MVDQVKQMLDLGDFADMDQMTADNLNALMTENDQTHHDIIKTVINHADEDGSDEWVESKKMMAEQWRKKVVKEENNRLAKKEAKKVIEIGAIGTIQRPPNVYKRSKSKLGKNKKDKAIYKCTAVFPLPSKDPILRHKKMHEVAHQYKVHRQQATEFHTVSDMQFRDTSIHRRSSQNESNRAISECGPDAARPTNTEGMGSESTAITTTELLTAAKVFHWKEYSTNPEDGERPHNKDEDQLQCMGPFTCYKVKGCVSKELGAHVLLKFTNRSGYTLGECVVCLTPLLLASTLTSSTNNRSSPPSPSSSSSPSSSPSPTPRSSTGVGSTTTSLDPYCIYSVYLENVHLSSGSQKRGLLSGKFSLRYLPSPLSRERPVLPPSSISRPLSRVASKSSLPLADQEDRDSNQSKHSRGSNAQSSEDVVVVGGQTVNAIRRQTLEANKGIERGKGQDAFEITSDDDKEFV